MAIEPVPEIGPTAAPTVAGTAFFILDIIYHDINILNIIISAE